MITVQELKSEVKPMTVTEYRQKHPKCKYCIHVTAYQLDFGTQYECTAKMRLAFGAKRCPLYAVEEPNRIIEALERLSKTTANIKIPHINIGVNPNDTE